MEDLLIATFIFIVKIFLIAWLLMLAVNIAGGSLAYDASWSIVGLFTLSYVIWETRL